VRRTEFRLLIAFLPILSACTASDSPETPSSGAAYQRIVTLAPNLTELVFSAGAGELLVGVSAYSDYPPQVASIPVIGDAFTIDLERLALLQPDLLLAWSSGTPAHVIDELRTSGYSVETIDTTSLGDIPTALRRIGDLTGRGLQAGRVADEFDAAVSALRSQYADRGALRVFYQVSTRPLYTVSGEHYVSELIVACGGQNIFGELDELAPAVDVEAVLDRDPEVILVSGDAGGDAFDEWSRWPDVTANRLENRFRIPADQVSRPTTRVLVAGQAICDALQVARDRRGSSAVIDDR
jgi:iron complex transport system substrate-binding protein